MVTEGVPVVTCGVVEVDGTYALGVLTTALVGGGLQFFLSDSMADFMSAEMSSTANVSSLALSYLDGVS